MSKDNLEQLAKLAKLINTDKIITPEEIQQVVAALTTVLANNKKSTEALNAETKTIVQQALKFVNEQVAKLRQENADLRSQMGKDTEAKISDTLQKAQAFITEARAAMPKDGKDADPAAVVPLVMQQIKLPENKQYILTGEDVLNALSELPDEDDYKLDAKRIKGLPKNQLVHMGGSGRMKVYYFDLSYQCNGTTKTFNIPLNFGIIGVFSTQAPIIYRPMIDWTEGNRTLTLTSQVDAPQTGQTLWCQYIR